MNNFFKHKNLFDFSNVPKTSKFFDETNWYYWLLVK